MRTMFHPRLKRGKKQYEYELHNGRNLKMGVMLISSSAVYIIFFFNRTATLHYFFNLREVYLKCNGRCCRLRHQLRPKVAEKPSAPHGRHFPETLIFSRSILFDYHASSYNMHIKQCYSYVRKQRACPPVPL